MEDNGYLFEGEDFNSAQLELLIKILGTNQAIISLLCDKHSKTVDESDELFKDVQREASEYGLKILQDLYARKGKIDVGSLFDKKK